MESNSYITYSKTERNMFLIGVFGQSMIYEILATGFTYYLQSVIFIPAIFTSILFAVGKIWDAAKNPIIGTFVDRTHTKWGKCRPYLLFTPPILCIMTILCFANGMYGSSNTSLANIAIVFWAIVSYLLWGIVYSTTDVPLWGIISLITKKEDDRSSILMAARNISNIGCGVVSFVLIYISQYVANHLSSKTENNNVALQYGMIITVVITTVVASVMFQMAGPFVKERISVNVGEEKNIKENFALMWKCKPFRQLLLSGILRSPVSVLRRVQLTLITYYYGDNGQTSYLFYFILLGGGYMVGQFVAIAYTAKITAKIAKDKLFILINVLSIIPFGLLFLTYCFKPSELDAFPWLYIVFILFTLMGASAGFISAVQSLMIADTVDYEEYKSGYRPDALFYSLQSFLSNFASGIASLISGVAFSIVGFSGEGVKAVNNALYAGGSFKLDSFFAPYRFCMFFLCTVVPIIGLALSVIPLRKYPLPDSLHKKIIGELHIEENKDENTEII